MTRDDILQPPGALEAESDHPSWGLRRVMEICGAEDRGGRHAPVTLAFARYIEQHEQPPVDPDVLAVRAVLAAAYAADDAPLRDVFGYKNGDYDSDRTFIAALEAYRTIKANGGVVK